MKLETKWRKRAAQWRKTPDLHVPQQFCAEEIEALLDDIAAAALTSPSVADSPTSSNVRHQMRKYLDTLTIHGGNIGDIRRSLFMPFDGEWNSWVRDDTAARECLPPSTPAGADQTKNEER